MTKSAFRFLLVWALCLFGSGYALAAPIAYVHELTGNMAVQYGNGAPQALKIGSTIEPGGVLSTGAASNAIVKFEDGQLMVMQPNTSFAVRQYDYVKTNVAKSSAVFELLKGGLRFVTGVIGATNKDAFKLTAGTATIGIRGTDGTVIYDAIANVITAAVNAGALALQTPLGITNIPVGNFSSASPAVPPSTPVQVAQATAVVAAQLAQASAVSVPINTPVVVAASAQAAVAQATAQAAAEAAAAAPTSEAAQQAAAAAQAEANTALQAAVQAATQAFQQAIQAGAVAPTPPAPPVTPPSTPGAAVPASSVAAEIEALPAPAAGPAEQPSSAAPTPAPASSGSGSGGGGVASPS
jgi:hypothetical protein